MSHPHMNCAVWLLFAGFTALMACPEYAQSRENIPLCSCPCSSPDPERDCACVEWRIGLNKDDGRRWGTIAEKTREGAVQRLRRDQETDAAAEQFLGTRWALHSFNPEGPCCQVQNYCPASPKLDLRTVTLLDSSRPLMDDYFARLQSSILRLRQASQGKAVPTQIGVTLREYVRVMTHAREKLEQLHNLLEGASRKGLGQVEGAVHKLLADLESDSASLRQEEAKVVARLSPPTARPPSPHGDWKLQSLTGFDGSPVIQRIVSQGKTLRVTSESPSGQLYQTTTIAVGVVRLPTLIVAQSGPDKWSLTVEVNDRSIQIEVPQGAAGARATDQVSRTVLFFGSRDAAEAAADGIKKLATSG